MSKFEQYFNKDFQHLLGEKIDLNQLLQGDLTIISGDFYGIQKFIFEGLVTKQASKVLRAKSAFVQLFTITLARYICDKLDIDEKSIISSNAGKFEIISQKNDEELLNKISTIVDSYFIKNFHGLSGMSITFVQCTKNDFIDSGKYQILRKKIADTIELKKFHKFDLQNQQTVLNYDDNIDNQSLCKVCNIRKISKENCDICNMFIELGKRLVDDKVKEVSSRDDLKIFFEDFDTKIVLDKKIKSYILKDSFNAPQTFEVIAQNSCEAIDTGIESLGILKADVDGMGNFIKNSPLKLSFEEFDMFSKTIDNFFSLHIPKVMQEKYPNSYTVFAGGDDLFLVGSWDVILELARFIESEFKKFIKSKELTISFGIAIAKPSTPISYLAEYTEHLLEEAKAIDDKKDAISLFGETVKWESYKKIVLILENEFSKLSKEDINTALLYRLLEFCDMSKKAKEGDIQATMWKSKLRYSFSRNNAKLGETFFMVLDNAIDNNPKESKMYLSEFIYKRRD